MKIHVEIDCTPEEARSFMGLPDVGKANAVYVDMMSKAMSGVSDTEKLQEYARQLAPMVLRCTPWPRAGRPGSR